MFSGLRCLKKSWDNWSNARLFKEQCTQVPILRSLINPAFLKEFRWWETRDCSIPSFSPISQTHSSPRAKWRIILNLFSLAMSFKSFWSFLAFVIGIANMKLFSYIIPFCLFCKEYVSAIYYLRYDPCGNQRFQIRTYISKTVRNQWSILMNSYIFKKFFYVVPEILD